MISNHLSAIEPVGIVAVVSINTIWNKKRSVHTYIIIFAA